MTAKKKVVDIGPAELLKVGDRVRHFEEVNGTPDGKSRVGKGWVEYGTVVQVWDDNEWQDCYVAFVGFKPDFDLKKRTPKEKPYILRYHYTSLGKI